MIPVNWSFCDGECPHVVEEHRHKYNRPHAHCFIIRSDQGFQNPNDDDLLRRIAMLELNRLGLDYNDYYMQELNWPYLTDENMERVEVVVVIPKKENYFFAKMSLHTI